jgi:hypothetical protein
MPTDELTKLKILLLESGERQYKVAAACDMHPYTLSQYATGQKPIPRYHLRSLARYFHCRQKDIVGWEKIEW